MIQSHTEQSSTVSSQEITTLAAYPKMDPALKTKWVAALRSGEFKQGRLYFNRHDKFCCLGVLCDTAGEPPEVGPNADNWEFVEKQIQDGGAIARLVGMNDDMNKSFEEIAQYIEANL